MAFHHRVTGLLLFAVLFLLSTPTPLLSSASPMPSPAPMLISPANGAVMDNGCQDKSNGVTWDFDWSDVPGATAYHLRVWRNPALPVVNNMSIPASSYHDDSPGTYIINSNLNGWRWMEMDGAGQGQRCLGAMERRALVPGGKTKRRLSIVSTRSLSELHRIPRIALVRRSCVAVKGDAVSLERYELACRQEAGGTAFRPVNQAQNARTAPNRYRVNWKHRNQ